MATTQQTVVADEGSSTPRTQTSGED